LAVLHSGKAHQKYIFSKEAIEDTLSNNKGLPVAGLNAAALFCRRPKKRRRPLFPSEKSANLENSTVRLNKMVELRGVEPLSKKAVQKSLRV